MCARRPTGAMPKPFLCCERAFCCSMVVMCRGGDLTSFDVMRLVAGWDEAIKVLLQYYSVLQSTTPVLLCTAKCYSSTTLYYKVLLQYYSLLHSTTTYYSSTTLYYKVLLCTAKYYSSTTLYYKVLYSSTTLYYKVLLQYYSVLQSTTPVLLCTTQYYNVLLQYYTVLQSSIHDWCPSHMKRHLQCAEQQESSSNVTKYCTCHAKWLWWLIRVTYETSFTMSGATGITIHLHQILPLPRKMNLMIDPRHIWNVIYNAQSKQSQPPTSANTAPATQNEPHDWSASHMKRHLQCAEQAQSATSLTKYCACHEICKFKTSAETPWIASANRKTIRRQSDDNPTTIRRQSDQKIATRTRRFGDLTRPTLNTILYWKIQHFALRLSPKMSPNAAPATKSHTPTSPNTAPATQNESHDWSAPHMKRHFQCAEQAKSTSNLSK